MQLPIKTLMLAVLLLPIASAQASCGGAFCALNSDWDLQGVWDKPGMRLDARAEYLNLDKLRHGSSKAGALHEDGEEDEQRTINRNLLATLDYSFNPDWGVTFKLPLISRSHNHIENDAGTQTPESWNFSGIGDMQALGRYNFYSGAYDNAGLRFGLKLPTGSIDQKNNDGVLAERGLQPGSGSVDSLLGAYYNRKLGKTSWFLQGLWQDSLSQRDHFDPGRKLYLDTGISYKVSPDLNLLLQLNLLHKASDSGSEAEPDNSGGKFAFVSPGFSYRIKGGTQVYGFVQKHIYQYVNGRQLTADWSAAFGISTQF